MTRSLIGNYFCMLELKGHPLRVREGEEKKNVYHAGRDGRKFYISQYWHWLKGGKEKSLLRIWAKAGIHSGPWSEITLPGQCKKASNREFNLKESQVDHSSSVWKEQMKILSESIQLVLVLSNMVATSHMWLFKFKTVKIKWNLKFTYSIAWAAFQVFKSHRWLMETILDRTDQQHFNISNITQCSFERHWPTATVTSHWLYDVVWFLRQEFEKNVCVKTQWNTVDAEVERWMKASL